MNLNERKNILDGKTDASKIELWKSVIGYEGLYEVSSLGNVKSLGRTIRDSIGRVRRMKPKLMSPSVTAKRGKNDKGYLEVRLTNSNGVSKNLLVHRLVAESFLENQKDTVNHIDGDKHNNRLDNLEWATYSENNQHAYDNNLKSDNRVVVMTDFFGKIVSVFNSMHEAGRETGVDYRRIHKLCNSENNFDGENYWSYIEDYKVDKNTIYFAKTDKNAVIPSKREEDGAYDIYSLIQPRETSEGLVYEQYLEKGKVNTIKTGIASAVSKDFYLSLNSERSSIAKHGINVLAGTIDSGYRGEIMLMVVPLVKDVLISSMVEDVEEHENLTIIPYKKAVAQATLLPVPDVTVEELKYEDLLEIESERGTGGWGSSGK